MRMRTLCEITLSDLRCLRIDIAGNDSSVSWEGLGPSQCAISGKHSDFQNPPCPCDEGQHFQEFALEWTDHHPWVARFGKRLQPEFFVETGQWLTMPLSVFLDAYRPNFDHQFLLA